ncbi:UDP-N-acetylglucosamine--N-acetylmuramyl-(pentapeptide) pyrophosphoryl-undecaprenol N-acetylglucosamine transferase [Acetoanaerobium pronyense]|uniref:UDP-N-acetylglucosamine--N-acetylmuramyl-(pentapeptide) pyrophosphoryl-undecaprenol N-acetylglucosamine transferase n=1 Tax=Acetoanaerobium pronyense TaxID=1482736 RepID=A0ABS4KFV8_9FIRM|nr:undecaprenyldiphospho-muramoylpentapeptide beta-N-acetylglucosaminyltransferase [Acetoanaerobium pronyense]MBP2026669.1 UDP-N-acetylglucosamine--N-acetylmuramyl-(pentapeptide) pyrophosphoryl-undecaprenol N-acetylglucosamine transferase [Acetoanaerobium pronyense]
MKLIVAGGGTGGHIYPALSIADKFMEKEKNLEVLYIGTPNSLESKIVPAYGYRFKTIDVKGFPRKLNIESMKRTIKLLKSLSDVRKIIKEEKPDMVIGTGGYVSGPVVMIASLMGIKTAIHEQNVFPGVTNKLLSKKTDYILTGFEESIKRFKYPEKSFFVGNPIRQNYFNDSREKAKESLNIPLNKKLILSVGGSGGSTGLNKAIKEMILNDKQKDYFLIHVTGRYHYKTFIESLGKEELNENFQILPYIDKIGTYMSASDLIICSAGAITLAEVSFLGRASIVIPKANTAENHQEYNAKSVENSGAGFFIKEKDLSYEILKAKINEIIFDEGLKVKMEKSSKLLSKSCPSEEIYNIVMRNS